MNNKKPFKLKSLKAGDRFYSTTTGWTTIGKIVTIGGNTYLYGLPNNLIAADSSYLANKKYVKVRETDKRIFDFSC